MAKQYEQSSFKKLLEKLQEESWQLELIISGFAIYGLFVAYPEIGIGLKAAQNDQNVIKFIPFLVAQISCAILIFNLLLHVLLRGLWIGALGLRYVSGDIDYDNLKYSPKFTNFLRKRVGSFDRYIANLENYCSVIFAVSFLLIFYVLAFTLTMVAISLIGVYLIGNDEISGNIGKIIGIPLVIFLSFGMFFIFFDFITQGLLKKKQWISKIYFPVYWVFSFITLSFLYRPLVYNFLDNKFTKRLSLILIPIYVLILAATSLKYQKSNYLSIGNNSSEIQANDKNYEDMLQKEGEFIQTVAIPSKVINDNFLKVFVVYVEGMEDRIFSLDSTLKPEKDKRGLRSDIQFSNDGVSWRDRDSIKRRYVDTFNKLYQVMIDSTEVEYDFILGQSETPEKELGFETYVSLDSLSHGKHMLVVKRDRIEDNDTTMVKIGNIPFWYFKD